MKRRIFLRNALSFSLLSALPGSILAASGSFLANRNHKGHSGKVLVLVQLDGGNDGLNTVIPLDQYARLMTARKNIMIPERKVLPLYDTLITGMHPAMAGMQRLYNDKRLCIIQGVGNPKPDLSHFNSIDTWHSGSEKADTLSTGWIGRFLSDEKLHDARMADADPPAIQIGPAVSKVLQGPTQSMGMVLSSISSFYDIPIGNYGVTSGTTAGRQLAFYRRTAEKSKANLHRVKAAAKAQKSLSNMYPPAGDNPLADQLKIVAQLIGGGLRTQVYVVSLSGFDTHDMQVESKDTTQGDHANLLGKLSVAVAAFEDDLARMGKQDNVIGMTYSEFGRRIRSNASYGSDHGTAAPVMLFGTQVKGGLTGTNPQIADKVGINDNLPMQIDFRAVYANVLRGWFGVSDQEMTDLLPGNYPVLDLFKA